MIPEDPDYVPDWTVYARARERFYEIAPKADEINITVTETLEFFDCGANFERMLCPDCREEIPFAWWHEKLDLDGDHCSAFILTNHSTPCCSASHTLHELVYDWPQGFGRFGFKVMNPNIGKLDDKVKREFEDILGCELRVIYKHL